MRIAGFAASALGIAALVLSVLSYLHRQLLSFVPPLGLSATLITIAALAIATLKSRLFSLVEVLALVIMAISVVLYFVEPQLVLPIAGASFLALGLYGYWLYYTR